MTESKSFKMQNCSMHCPKSNSPHPTPGSPAKKKGAPPPPLVGYETPLPPGDDINMLPERPYSALSADKTMSDFDGDRLAKSPGSSRQRRGSFWRGWGRGGGVVVVVVEHGQDVSEWGAVSHTFVFGGPPTERDLDLDTMCGVPRQEKHNKRCRRALTCKVGFGVLWGRGAEGYAACVVLR